jgi:hypothetical protein
MSTPQEMDGPEEFIGAEQDPAEQPQGQDVPEDEGVLQPGDTLETDDLQADPLETGISPPERHPASEWYGVTQAEAREGESLDQRLAQEQPEEPPVFGGGAAGDGPEPEYPDEDPDVSEDELPEPRAGRLVAPDEGSHPAEEPAYLARDVGIDGAAASAEEAAMHVVAEEPETEF